jgi:hypothetical protein
MILLILAFALTLIICEVGLRLLVEVTDVPFYYWDPTVGPRISPNQSGRHIGGSFVDGRFSFNSQGWNHPEDYVIEKKPGTLRVCLVGDSYVEAAQVVPDRMMNAVAQRLMDRPDRPVQWYPFGVSGFGTAAEYEVIRNYVLDYHPDLVILLFVQNDPADSSPYISDLPPYEVRYVLDGAGGLHRFPPTEEWRPTQWRRLAARSAMVRYFMIQRGLLGALRRLRGGTSVGSEPLREGIRLAGSSIVEGIEHMSIDERGRKTWDLIATLLEAIRDECNDHGARFAIAFRGWRDEIDAPIEPEIVEPVPEGDDPHCLGRRMREMGREFLSPIAMRLEIPYLDLTGALHDEVAATGKSHRFPNDNHFSEIGHDAAGKALAAWGEELLASPVPHTLTPQ